MALDARAAELKEKLTKRKTTKTSPTQFVPHPLPQVPRQTTVDATPNDITDLITSISSNIPAGDGKQGAMNSNSQGRPSGSNTVGSSGMGAHQVQDSRPSVSKATSGDFASKSSQVEFDKTPSQVQEVSQRQPPTEFKVKGTASAGSAATNPPPPSERATRPETDQRAGQPTNTPATNDTNQTREPQNRTANSGGNGKSDKTADLKGLGLVEQAQEIVTEGTWSLGRIVDDNADLKDWLDLTNWHDVEARNRKLSRYRRAKALAAEKERIEEEERKLREEEALEMGFRPPISVPSQSETPLQTPISQPASSVFSMPASATETTAEQQEATPAIPAKRFLSPDCESTEKAETRPEKMARREVLSTQPTETMRVDTRYEDARRGRDTRKDDQHEPRLLPPVRDLSPRRSYRAPSPRRDYSPKRTVYPEAPRGPREEAADKSRPEYDSYKGGGVRREYQRESSPHRGGGSGQASRHLDLGREGETRFFIIKSFNEDNVRKCMIDGVWATQSRNGQTLTRAFASCKNVILFFSINKSRAFQGYARMSTAPSPDTPRPGWMNNVHWDSSPPFRVEWLNKVPVQFSRINGLKNSYNDDHPVLVGKDGQEVEERCGRELLRVMQNTAAAAEGGGGAQQKKFDTPRKEPQQQGGGGRGPPGGPAVSPPGHGQRPGFYPPPRGKRGGYRGGYRGGHRSWDTPPGRIKDEDLGH